MAKINNKNDCREILLNLEISKEFDFDEEEFLIVDDPNICMINGGNTRIVRCEEEEFRHFSSGQGWQDQGWSYFNLNSAIDFLWRARKSINK